MELAAFNSTYSRNSSSNGDLAYGTGGFRMEAEKLDYVVFRMGILAAIRSRCKGAACGVMITASHNPVADNGVKIIDPHGEMLEISWEPLATQIANCRDEDLERVISNISEQAGVDMKREANVFVGMDTRPSSEKLAKACKDGVEAVKGTCRDFGLLTTPQLHYIVCAYNTEDSYPATAEGYYLKMVSAFKEFVKLATSANANSDNRMVVVDGANGVGALKTKELSSQLSDVLQLVTVFDGYNGVLNHQCGADYVKTNQKAPAGLEMTPLTHYASLDGDADRLVYYFTSEDGSFHLLDGDKISILTASYIKGLLEESGIQINVGIVQTAYANGASTDYVTKTLNIPVTCTKTGVKYLHHAAQDYDIGVYFEANGHGTVIFSPTAQAAITEAAKKADKSDSSGAAVLKLQFLMQIINQTVGDAISDLLMVEAILLDKNMSLVDWNNQYTDLPNGLRKVKVADRTVIETTNAERQTTKPPELQPAIDAAVQKYSRARSFVRPSGTEDLVRVYAEAETAEEVSRLAQDVSNLVYNLCGGIGGLPA